jgi:serine/threonine protein kinase
MPPEMFAENPKYSEKVDVWSAGIVVFCMIYTAFPITGTNFPEIIR